MTSPLRAGAAGALAVLMLAAGCGGGGDDRLSQAEFQQKADAICQKSRDALAPAAKNTNTMAGLKKYAGTAAFAITAEATALATLKPPKDKQDAFNRAKALVAFQAKQAVALFRAASTGDTQKINQVAQQLNSRRAEGKQLGQELGLKVCGQAGTS